LARPPIDSTKTKRKAIDTIYELAKSSIPAGRDPRCLAAAVLYLASSNTGENVSQKELAETSED
jgi:transcription initiation factor TFIIIB Brf1 subunit/transcription initiation factor TFIIB